MQGASRWLRPRLSALSRFLLFLRITPRHAVSNLRLVDDVDGVAGVVGQLGAQPLDNVAHRPGDAGLCHLPRLLTQVPSRYSSALGALEYPKRLPAYSLTDHE